jgi:hypothetical protein
MLYAFFKPKQRQAGRHNHGPDLALLSIHPL